MLIAKPVAIALLFFLLPKMLWAQNGYRIDGYITGLAENSKVYLIDGGQRKTIDSAIVTNSRFLLKGRTTEAVHTYLYEGKTNKLADILLDNRQIAVAGSQPVYDSVQVSGSEIDAQWKEWYREDRRIGHLRFRLNQLSKALVEKQDTASNMKIKQLIDELTGDRVALLKYYVKKYGSASSGAVLPTMCTIQDQLTRNDFLEMYRSLSPLMQTTQLGKEVKEMADKN